MQITKKLCAILLVLCMLIGVLPFGALAAETTAQIAGRQLMLGDDLCMHFHTKIEGVVDNATATIYVDGAQAASYRISGMTAGEQGYDLFVHLGAPQMTDEIKLVVNDGQSDILTDVYTVREYAQYLLDGNYTNETKALVRELLNYGAKAQQYFGHKTGDLANAGNEIETAPVTEAPAEIAVTGAVDGIAFYGSSMVFRSQIAIRYYFSAPNGIEGYTVTVDGQSRELKQKDSTLYYVEVAGIIPDAMGEDMAVEVTDGTDSFSFTYSPKAYISRMYNRETTSDSLKALLAAANSYFDAAKVFTGVAENRTGSLTMAYRYGTNNLIQVNTNIPADTPLANFTTGQNGCSIDESANQYQQAGWIGMDNVDGTIVLTFHFNGNFEAGQTYTLPKGAVFGFTDNSKYTLDKNYTFTFDGASWAMETAEPAINLTYRYGTAELIQFNTDLPASTPIQNFLAGDNGSSLTQNVPVGWIGMENVDGTIVLTFHFNAAFAEGDSYTLSAGSIFGFTDGSKYQLNQDVVLYWHGEAWESDAYVAPLPSLSFQYRYGANNLIQVNTNLPASTPIQNFLVGDNGCEIDESANQYQNVAWIAMANVEDTIVLTFNFGAAFEAGQSYTLPAGAIFGFTDGNRYALDGDYTFTFDGASWAMTTTAEPPATEPPVTEPEPTEPPATEPEMESIGFQYRYGSANLIQVNTNLPTSTPCVNFTADQNGCSIDQSGNTVQWVGWIGMDNVDGTIVLSFHFNQAFSAGQSYVLPAGSIFGFTDGNTYALDSDYTFTFDGASWSMEGGAEVEPEQKNINLSYRYGTAELIQFNTDLPASTPIQNFLAGDNGSSLTQNVQVGWIGMDNVDGTIVLSFHFNAAFAASDSYTLSAGSVFGFTDGNTYTLPADVTLYWDGAAWGTEAPAKTIALSYRYGTAELIQFNTDLPATTPIQNFLAGDNGSSLTQNVPVGWIGMDNVDGTIVLTFHFNAAFAVGNSYTLSAGSIFGFTDGNTYTLPADVTLYWDGAAWGTEAPAKTIALSYRYGTAELIQFNTDLPATTPIQNFLAGDNGSSLTQNVPVGWIGMENVEGTIVLTFHFNAAFAVGNSYTLSAGSIFGFTDGNTYTLPADVTLYWDGAAWGTEAPADVLDESNFSGGKNFITFADLPVDGTNADKIAEYQALGFNTALLAEDHTGGKGPDELFAFGMQTNDILTNDISFAYRWGNANTIQVNTNLPSTTPLASFTAYDNGCIIDQSGNQYQQVGWIGMDNASGTIVLTFHFNGNFEAGQTYVLPKGAIFGFTDGSMYTLDQDYTFSFDGSGWSLSGENAALHLTLNSSNAKLIQLKTNIPTGLTYGDFLVSTPGDNILLLETTDGALDVAWFTYGETVINAETGETAVFFNFNFGGIQKPGTTYTLKKGTALKAGNTYYTLQSDYTFTLQNAYLTSLENLDNAGMQIWIRNYHNRADYFTPALSEALALYREEIDGFYMADEIFQTNALLNAAGQADTSSDLESMTVVRDWFNTYCADKYFHVNHVPITSYDHYTSVSGGTLSAMDAEGYKNFLQSYKAAYNDQLGSASGTSIGFDNYPFAHAQGNYKYGTLNLYTRFESGIQDSYLLNALLAAQVAGEDDLSICVQTFKATDPEYKVERDIVSAAEVSLQLYTGMAMGADVFEYFAYNSNGQFSGIMNTDGSKRIYDLVKEGNEALCFHDVVNSFAWNGIMTSTGTVNSHNTEAFSSVSGMVLADDANGVLSSVASTDDAIVGCFTKNDLNGYMVVNFNDPAAVTGNNTVTLNFADCARARVYTCVDGVLTSQLVELTDGACAVTLEPGSGCFVIPA